MIEWLFWLLLLAFCLFLWWLSFYATKRMYRKKRDAAPARPTAQTHTEMEDH